MRVDGASLDANTDFVQNDVFNIDMKYLITISLVLLAVIGFVTYRLVIFRRKNKTFEKERRRVSK
jgi:heme/copper-type cytochrome/quinol oxidase subunit 2